MTTNIVRKLGVLLVLSLVIAVCCGAGAAAPTEIYDGAVTLVNETYFSSNSYGIPFTTDLGVLALASTETYGNYDFTVNLIDKGNYTISFGGYEGSQTHRWYVFVNQTYYGENYKQMLMPMSSGDIVTAYYAENIDANKNYETAKSNAQYFINVTVAAVKEEQINIYDDSVSLTPGTFTKEALDGKVYTFDNLTGLGALHTASIKNGFTYNISMDWGSAYIEDINGVKDAYSKLGYAWASYQDEYTTAALDRVTVTSGDTLNLYYCPSGYFGTIPDMNYDSYYSQNYLTSSSYRLNITVNPMITVEDVLGDTLYLPINSEGIVQGYLIGSSGVALDDATFTWTVDDSNLLTLSNSQAGTVNYKSTMAGATKLTISATSGSVTASWTLNIVVKEAAQSDTTNTNSGPSKANVLWSVKMGDIYNNGGELDPDGSPVVHDGKVYVTAWNMGEDRSVHGVYCFDAETGEEIWKSTGFTSRSGVAIHGDYLYVGYMDTEKATDWYGNEYAVGTGGVKCLNLETGEVIGDTGSISKLDSLYVGVSATPLIVGDKVWIYSNADYLNQESTLYSYDLDLNPTSQQKISLGGTSGGVYASASASPDGKTLYVPGGDGIYAIDVDTGTKLWYFEQNVDGFADETYIGTPVYSNGDVYFMVGNPLAVYGGYDSEKGEVIYIFYSGKLYSVDAITGKENWGVTHKAKAPTTPVVDSTYVYATGETGLTAYHIADGSIAWTHNGGDTQRASSTLAGNTIYYGTYEAGTLYAVSTAGTELWKFKPEYDGGYYTLFEGQPAVANGVLYAGCEGICAFYAISDAGTATPDDNTGNNSDTNTDGSTSGGTTYVPPVQTPTVSYTSINPGTGQMTYTTNHPNYPAATFTFDRMTAAGVLLSSGLNVVTAERWGGLYVSSINGKSADNDPTGGWICQVNGIPISVMMNNYPVSNGDKVVFYYSESMSSSPESSSYVYRFQVSSTAVPQPTPTPTETPVPESFTPAESPQITFQIPTGVTITTTETGKTVSIDTGLIKANDKSTVTVTEQAITITYPGVILTIDLTEYTKKGDLATATLGGMKAYLVPAPVTIPVGGYAV